MKHLRFLALLGTGLLLIASCGSPLPEEEVQKATAVSFASWMTAALSAGFGQAPEGVSVNDDQTVVTLDELDISEFQMGYESVSGTVTTDEEAGTATFDFTMEGGPVSSISYELKNSDIQSTAFDVTVTANNKKYDISLSGEDFQ